MNIWLYRVKKAFDTELKAYNKNILEKENIKMAIRITDKDLDNLCNRMNETLGKPLKPWIRENDRNKAQIGNIHVYSCLGVYALHEMVNESGGIRVIVSGSTKRECFDLGHAWLNGYKGGEQ